MSPCTDPTDPANMTAEERITEVAAILAEGIRAYGCRIKTMLAGFSILTV